MTYTFPIVSAFPATSLRREIDRLFEEVTTGRPQSAGWQPAVTAREEATGITIDIDVPGVSPEQVEVLAEDGVLTVKGTRKLRPAQEGERTYLAERPQGAFVRKFRLPKSADLQSVSAQYAHGVLTVHVAKVAPAEPRRVPVSVAVSESAH